MLKKHFGIIIGLMMLYTPMYAEEQKNVSRCDAVTTAYHQEDDMCMMLDAESAAMLQDFDFSALYDEICDQIPNKEVSRLEKAMQRVGAFFLTQYFKLESFAHVSKDHIKKFIVSLKSRFGHEKSGR